MKGLLVFAGVLSVLAVTPSTARAQPFQLDPCRVATFPDRTKRDEYQSLQAKLNLHPQQSVALRERTELTGKLWDRTPGNELRSRLNDTYRQVQEAVLVPELVEVQIVLMDWCLARFRDSPGTEIEDVRADVQFLRILLALPDGELVSRFDARLEAMLDAFGTPEAANQTLRIHLGLPVPH